MAAVAIVAIVAGIAGAGAWVSFRAASGSSSPSGAVAPTSSTPSPVAPNSTPSPTFKWSRENGSVVFPVLKLATSANQTTVTLANLGRDSRLSLQINDWVEVVDDASAPSGIVDSLLQVRDIDTANQVVTLKGTSGITVAQPPTTHPILRRWDGMGAVAESNGNLPESWLTLEDGVQIQFQPPAPGAPATQYRPGDYWLIPARVVTGNIEWPQQTDSQGNQTPAALPPHGVEHHYAPLALLSAGAADGSLAPWIITQPSYTITNLELTAGGSVTFSAGGARPRPQGGGFH